MNNRKKAWIILGVYLIATCALLLLGYGVQKPAVSEYEFPYTITYSLDGKTETISDVYVVEYVRTDKYIGDDSINWFGYIKDHDRLEHDYYTLAVIDDLSYAINLNMNDGYLMGDPDYADNNASPELVIVGFDGVDDIRIEDPAELKEMGFSLIGFEYPKPIDNAFSFGGIALSSQAVMLTSAIAVAALLASMIAIKRDKELTYSALDKISVIFNFLVVIIAFPFILIASSLSELVSDASFLCQVLYLTAPMTIAGVAASVILRRLGENKRFSFLVQFAGPLVFILILLLDNF